MAQVQDAEPSNATKVRINAERFWISGTTENLVTGVDDLLVSVGGFLGLFVGLSLLDVMEFMTDLLSALCKRPIKER